MYRGYSYSKTNRGSIQYTSVLAYCYMVKKDKNGTLKHSKNCTWKSVTCRVMVIVLSTLTGKKTTKIWITADSQNTI